MGVHLLRISVWRGGTSDLQMSMIKTWNIKIGKLGVANFKATDFSRLQHWQITVNRGTVLALLLANVKAQTALSMYSKLGNKLG